MKAKRERGREKEGERERKLGITFGLLLWLLGSSVGEGRVPAVHGITGSEYGGKSGPTVRERRQNDRKRHHFKTTCTTKNG